MGRGMDDLPMKTNQLPVADLFNTDINELKIAVMTILHDATKLGRMGFASHLLKWLAFVAAVYLLVLDRTNWRSNMLTSLLVPYIFLSLPTGLFHFLRGDVGKWIALVAVVLRLFLPRHFPDWLEIPGSLILLLVVAPDLFAHRMKDSWAGFAVLLFIGCYLLQEHIRSTGGLRNSLTQKNGFFNTIGLILLLAYPIWAVVIYIM